MFFYVEMFMLCRVDGCDSEAMYKVKELCQKHYFRQMRNGSTDLKVTTRKYRQSNPAGYQLLHEKDHPLATKNQYVYEHRLVIYNHLGGQIKPCEICGTPETWETCHIDHIDNDVTNNNIENLRVSCRACNVMRGHVAKENSFNSKFLLTYDGKTMSPWKWAAQDGVSVCGATIRRRKECGYSDYCAIFGDRKTHHNTKTGKKVYKEWSN